MDIKNQQTDSIVAQVDDDDKMNPKTHQISPVSEITLVDFMLNTDEALMAPFVIRNVLNETQWDMSLFALQSLNSLFQGHDDDTLVDFYPQVC